jgi:hypothetical protein
MVARCDVSTGLTFRVAGMAWVERQAVEAGAELIAALIVA